MIVAYIGYFKMPNGTAAAQLIRGMSKITNAAGYDVIVIDVSTENCEVMKVYESSLDNVKLVQIRYPNSLMGEMLRKTSYKEIKRHIPMNSIVIFYNYSAIVMLKAMIDKKRYVKFIPMITEWYSVEWRSNIKSILEAIVKKIDIDMRMRFVTKICKGVLVCSKYLGEYYSKSCKTLIIPTVIDYEQDKWNQEKLPFRRDIINFVYAGSLGTKKDRLIEIMDIIKAASKGKEYVIRIVGVTEEQFVEKYPDETDKIKDEAHVFMGRVPHEKCVQIILSSDYSILYRDNNRIANAGFPTKFAESMACGVPQIVTDTSDIRDYIEQDINGVIISYEKQQAVKQISEVFLYSRGKIDSIKEKTKNMRLFDYKGYIGPLREFLENV